MIEVTYAALRLKTGWSPAKTGQTAELATPVKKDQDAPALTTTPAKKPQSEMPEATPVANPYAVAAAAVAQVATPLAQKGPPRGAELRAALLEVLRDPSIAEEGLHVGIIAQKVGGAAVADVKVVVAELVDDGDLFSTITEEHFAAV